MKKFGELIESNILRFERRLPGTIEQVWEYLVDEEKRGLWFAAGETDLVIGGEMKFVFKNSQFTNPPEPTPDKYKDYGDGFVSIAQVVKCEAPRLLVIEWEGLVTFELEQIEDEVMLTLTHEKLQDTKDTKVGTLAGWHTHLDILLDRLSNRTPKGFWGVHMDLESKYKERI